MSNKKPSGKGGQAKIPKRKLSERWSKTAPVNEQLKGMECKHPGRTRLILTNSKGKQFNECGTCGAFLGWIL